MMMNGDLIKKATSTEQGELPATVASDSKLNNAAKINYLYLAALARKPTSAEIDAGQRAARRSRKGDPAAALARHVVGACSTATSSF